MKNKVITLDVLQEFKNRFENIILKDSIEKIPLIQIDIDRITGALTDVEGRIPRLSDDGNRIIFDNNNSFTHQSLEGYINKDNIEEIVSNKGFSKLTLDIVKADESFSHLIANKDKFITSQLTKDDIEAMGLSYNRLQNTPIIPTKLSELNNDEGFTTLTLDAVKSDTDIATLVSNKNKYLTEHQSLTDYAKKVEIPSDISQLTDTSSKLLTLNQVKNNISYNDLKDTPDLLTLAEVKGDADINQLLINKDKYVTDISNLALKSEIFSGDYSDLKNTPTLITSYNDLKDKPELFDGNYASLTGKPSIPSKLSDLTNDSNYQTAANVDTIISNKGYQTAQDVELTISGKGFQTENDINLIISGKGFQTASDFINTLKEKGILNSEGNLSISADNITGLGLLAKKDNLSAEEVGARASDWIPTANEINTSLSKLSTSLNDLLTKSNLRKNLGLGSLATKSSVTTLDLAAELKAMQEAVTCLVAAQDTTFVTKLDNLLVEKELGDFKYASKIKDDDYISMGAR